MINRILIDVLDLELDEPSDPKKGGRPRLYADTHEDLQKFLDRTNKFFDFIDDNPTKEEVLFHNKGEIIKGYKTTPAPYTIQGLELFLGMVHSRFEDYAKRGGYRTIIIHAKQIIYNQKLTGGIAGIYNSNILAKELGLASKRELELTQGSGPSAFIVQLATDKGKAGNE